MSVYDFKHIVDFEEIEKLRIEVMRQKRELEFLMLHNKVIDEYSMGNKTIDGILNFVNSTELRAELKRAYILNAFDTEEFCGKVKLKPVSQLEELVMNIWKGESQ